MDMTTPIPRRMMRMSRLPPTVLQMMAGAANATQATNSPNHGGYVMYSQVVTILLAEGKTWFM